MIYPVVNGSLYAPYVGKNLNIANDKMCVYIFSWNFTKQKKVVNSNVVFANQID